MSDQRPTLAISRDRAAVEAFVRELQSAIDTSDPDLFDRSFAADVLWGSPFGGVVEGYEQINAIHRRMFASADRVPGVSRYTIEHVRQIRDDVVLAFVRRQSAQSTGKAEPGKPEGFDELALFVLVLRDGGWWLAAGQHVPDRRDVYGARREP